MPADVTLALEADTISVKGNEGENVRTFNLGRLEVSLVGKTLKIGSDTATKTEKKMMNTITAHINNMIKGVQEKFVYELKICSGHFPMTVKQEGSTITVKNFLGEKINRTCQVVEGSEIKIDKEMITVTSVSKELAGQTAANFEFATKIRGRDKRIFQDGIYIIKKAGKEI